MKSSLRAAFYEGGPVFPVWYTGIGDNMGCLWKLMKYILGLIVMLLLGAACYAGNMAYEYVWNLPWNRVLAIDDHRQQLSRMQYLERYYAWPEVKVTSRDGTVLAGTYMEGRGHRYVILLHGIYQNRSMMIPYARLYRDMGYHVVMADLRGHGQSRGETTDWGIHDTEDMDAWTAWIKSKDPEARIGLHGVSLGAAMALIYAGSKNGQNLHFCVADSAYGNLMEMGREKLLAYTGEERLVWGIEMLNPFFQGALYLHTGKLLSDIDPMDRAAHITAPVLFLHGASDTLVPPATAEELYENCSSSRKKLYIFQGAAHTMEINDHPQDYTRAVRDFLEEL